MFLNFPLTGVAASKDCLKVSKSADIDGPVSDESYTESSARFISKNKENVNKKQHKFAKNHQSR